MKTTFVVPDDLEPARRADDATAVGDVIPPHNKRCFGCGPDAMQGLHLQAIAGEGLTATAVLEVERRFAGGPGVIHGGILASAFDEMMGLTNMLMGTIAVTAVLDVDYAAPIQVGTSLRMDARVLGLRGRKVYSEVVAYDAATPGDPLAGGHGLFVVVDPVDHFTRANARP
ncbi:PaaI family thioesterase [Williamsia deligens]|uniref:Acyl-coenzyme A thioesterase THEM4 n=1 Tax=Williamsia deligens TaxID=321325 RepID=A0ABW3G3S1_9NOCA|nr:PaaI family thioesterase [Williamsia deligens]MCP2194392.1 Acyl-coenzyme A thioesterase PaaI, contains HGG motif [Williamsia deligens]